MQPPQRLRERVTARLAAPCDDTRCWRGTKAAPVAAAVVPPRWSLRPTRCLRRCTPHARPQQDEKHLAAPSRRHFALLPYSQPRRDHPQSRRSVRRGEPRQRASRPSAAGCDSKHSLCHVAGQAVTGRLQLCGASQLWRPVDACSQIAEAADPSPPIQIHVFTYIPLRITNSCIHFGLWRALHPSHAVSDYT